MIIKFAISWNVVMLVWFMIILETTNDGWMFMAFLWFVLCILGNIMFWRFYKEHRNEK